MSEPRDRSVHSRLKRQAEQLESLASESATRSSFSLNNAEEQELRDLVQFLRGNLDELRLANVQARLRDVEQILRDLKADLASRREQGRPTRVIEAMVWEAENERGRVMASLSHVTQTPSRYLAFHHSGESHRSFSPPDFRHYFQNLGPAHPPRFDPTESIYAHRDERWRPYPVNEFQLTRSVYEGVRGEMASGTARLGLSGQFVPYEDEPELDYDSLEDSIAEHFQVLDRSRELEELWTEQASGSWEEVSQEEESQEPELTHLDDFDFEDELAGLELEDAEDLEIDEDELAELDLEDDELEEEDLEDLEIDEDDLTELELEDEDLDEEDFEDLEIDEDELAELEIEDEELEIDEDELAELEVEDEELEEEDLEDLEIDEEDLAELDLEDEELEEEDFEDLEIDEDELAELEIEDEELEIDEDELAELELEDEDLAELEVEDEELEEEDLEDLEIDEDELAELEVEDEELEEEDLEDLEIDEEDLAELDLEDEELEEEDLEDLEIDEEDLAELDLEDEELEEEDLEDLEIDEDELEIEDEELEEDDLAELELEDDELEIEDEELEEDDLEDLEIDEDDLTELELEDEDLAELEIDEDELAELELEDEDLAELEVEDEELEEEDLEDLEIDEDELAELEIEDEELEIDEDELAELEVEDEELEEEELEDLAIDEDELAELEVEDEELDEEDLEDLEIDEEDLAELDLEDEELEEEDLEDLEIDEDELAELDLEDEELEEEDLEDLEIDEDELAELELEDEDLAELEIEDDELEIDEDELAELDLEDEELEIDEDEDLAELERELDNVELDLEEQEPEAALESDQQSSMESVLLEGVASLETSEELIGTPDELGAPDLLGAPELEGDPDNLFSGPASDTVSDDFFSAAAPTAVPSIDEDEDDLISDLEADLDEHEEQERLAPPSKEYRSTILEALRQVQHKGDAASTRADVLSVLESAVPKEYRAAVSERRRLVRLSCEYEVNCFQGNQIFHATIRDISLGGMKIEVARQLEAGSELQVSNPNRTENDPDERVTAQVRWFRVKDDGKAEVGLQFVDPPEVLGRSWVVSLLNRVGMQSQAFNQRRYTRAVADFDIEIVDSSGELQPGRCVDLGLGGALIDTLPIFEQGDVLTFRSPSFGIHGKLEAEAKVINVKHQDDSYGRYAIEFENLDAATTKLLGRYVVDLLKLGRGYRHG